jgi:hypothetical protein
MIARRTNAKRSGHKTSTRSNSRRPTADALDHAVVLIDAVSLIAGSENLLGNSGDEQTRHLRAAIADHNTPLLFEALMEAFSFQGISDAVARGYMDAYGRPSWRAVERSTIGTDLCPKLKSFWSYNCCGYEKSSWTCAEQDRIACCRLPHQNLRTGRLNQTATALFLFIRDVANGDLVGWIDEQLRQAAKGSAHGRSSRMRESLIGPLRQVFGISDKVLNMALSDLLTAAPRTKRHWAATGTSMIAIDTLVHNWLHRTGILRRFNSKHSFGPACYRPKGCADIITQVAARIDARLTNSKYPATFPRFVQHAIWRYCAQLELDVCNGNRTNNRNRCANRGCPLFTLCDRVVLQPVRP